MMLKRSCISLSIICVYFALGSSLAFAFECEDLKKDLELDFKNQPTGLSDSLIFQYFSEPKWGRSYWAELWKGAMIDGVTVRNLQVLKTGDLVFSFIPKEGGGDSYRLEVKPGNYRELTFKFPKSIISGHNQQLFFGSNQRDFIFFDALTLHLDLKPMFSQLPCQN